MLNMYLKNLPVCNEHVDVTCVGSHTRSSIANDVLSFILALTIYVTCINNIINIHVTYINNVGIGDETPFAIEEPNWYAPRLDPWKFSRRGQ